MLCYSVSFLFLKQQNWISLFRRVEILSSQSNVVIENAAGKFVIHLPS